MNKTLKIYMQGLEDVDFNKVTLAGEDFVNDRIRVSIYDLADWIREGARIEMTKEDMNVIKEYIDNHL